MGTLNILKELLNRDCGCVLVDKSNGIVQAWTIGEPFQRDRRKLRALKSYFPNLEEIGPILRLGSFPDEAKLGQAIKGARARSTSLQIKTLFYF
jgi:hypothetical protein